MAAQAAQLELGVMIPVIADRLIASMQLADEVIEVFTKKCVKIIEANEERCKELLENSTAYATMLTPKLGYEQVSKMVKASRENTTALSDIREHANYGNFVIKQK